MLHIYALDVANITLNTTCFLLKLRFKVIFKVISKSFKWFDGFDAHAPYFLIEVF
jgi:hypothetical protein